MLVEVQDDEEPEAAAESLSDTPEDFNQTVSSILTGEETEKAPCGCGEVK